MYCMNSKIEKLILKIYILLPKAFKRNQKIIDKISPIAERQLSTIKQELIKVNWQRYQLERELSQLKVKLKDT